MPQRHPAAPLALWQAASAAAELRSSSLSALLQQRAKLVALLDAAKVAQSARLADEQDLVAAAAVAAERLRALKEALPAPAAGQPGEADGSGPSGSAAPPPEAAAGEDDDDEYDPANAMYDSGMVWADGDDAGAAEAAGAAAGLQ